MSNRGIRFGFIYFVASDEAGRFKIGKTAELDKRIGALRTSSPTPLYLHGYFQVTMKDLLKAERRMHKAFRRYRSHLEWYYLTDKTKIAIELAVLLDRCSLIESLKIKRMLEDGSDLPLPYDIERCLNARPPKNLIDIEM